MIYTVVFKCHDHISFDISFRILAELNKRDPYEINAMRLIESADRLKMISPLDGNMRLRHIELQRDLMYIVQMLNYDHYSESSLRDYVEHTRRTLLSFLSFMADHFGYDVNIIATERDQEVEYRTIDVASDE